MTAPPHASPADAPVVLDVGAALAILRRRQRWVLVTAALGLAMGLAVLLLAPSRFSGRTLLLIRTAPDATSLVARRASGGLAGLLPGGLGGSDEELATELTLLSSRSVVGAVVDSLRLQAIPARDHVQPREIVDSLRLPGRFRPVSVTLAPGKNAVAGGVVWARQEAKVKLVDREDAIDAVQERLSVVRAGGDAVELRYAARDSLTAAQVPNLAAEVYIVRRRTVDRGLNQRRLEFLAAKDDSVRLELQRSASALAGAQERSGGGADPQDAGKALAERLSLLDQRISEIRAGERALDSLLEGARSGRVDARAIAGFPDLLRSPAVNDIVSQVARLDMERTVALSRSAPGAPQVQALARARDSAVAQLLPIASTYRSSLARQRLSLERDRDELRRQIGRMPRQGVGVLQERAELERLAQLNMGMGAQVLEARLAALLEGGDVRLVDPAVPPRRVTFPRPLPTLAAGLLGGLLLGVLLAFLRDTRGAPLPAEAAPARG
ncbi:MAG TPA: hypothetical protein VGD77_03200 [Gemmatimonadaceae bacterium]